MSTPGPMSVEASRSSEPRSPPDGYRLLDFGDGRKLEQFGQYVLDRPAPAAESLSKTDPGAWSQAAARYERSDRETGQWFSKSPLPEKWPVALGGLTVEVKPTPFGHVGLFPEQAPNWLWIDEQMRKANRPIRILNMFAYTGGSTLAAARAGAEMVHVDSARGTVEWARRNALLSGLAAAPVRWITEDAMKFTSRELKRGNDYDAVILDPPSYGHGPAGEPWKIDEHLPQLLRLCAELTAKGRLFVLLTCHSPGYGPKELGSLTRDAFGGSGAAIEARELALESAAGTQLRCGAMARWTRSE